MKTVDIMVEFRVSIPDDSDPDSITFDIPMESVRVDSDQQHGVGKLVSYCTQEYVE
jgi:hypothetical protein